MVLRGSDIMSNYEKSLYKDYEKLQNKNDKIVNENKLLKLRISILESDTQRKDKLIEKGNIQIEQIKKEINNKNNEIQALKNKIIELAKKLDMTELERDKYLAKLNIDGTNAGIPTSQTPINKKKIIPNSRKKSENNIGGQKNHSKNKLNKFDESEINEIEEIELKQCPNCKSHNLDKIDSIEKDLFDYEIKVIKKRNKFAVYKCLNCGKTVKKNIPNNLKEENQYGSKVQATALTLTNIGNVPINKTRKIISGLTMGEIDLSEGFISKLQKRASSQLIKFMDDLKFYITHLKIIYWDDTVIMVNTKRSCMRFYGNEDVALYTAHDQKNKAGVNKDQILNRIDNNTFVMHDHNIINYSIEYNFINVECCQHLLRDLQKVKTNIPNRTWSIKMKELFQEYDHKRKELINSNIYQFDDNEFNNFINKINEYLLLGCDEYLSDDKVYYAQEEAALLVRLMEYRDNYIYWTLDFDLPFTNNLSERALRGIKSKMKVAGQFQNISNAEYYANIRSYIETCYRNGVNGHIALERLIDGNPYTLEEILEMGKNNAKKSEKFD